MQKRIMPRDQVSFDGEEYGFVQWSWARHSIITEPASVSKGGREKRRKGRRTRAHIRLAPTSKVNTLRLPSAESEIGEHDACTSVGEEDVVGLEVAMIYPLVVALLYCLEDIGDDAPGVRCVAVYGEVVLQRCAEVAVGVIVL